MIQRKEYIKQDVKLSIEKYDNTAVCSVSILYSNSVGWREMEIDRTLFDVIRDLIVSSHDDKYVMLHVWNNVASLMNRRGVR